MNRGKPGAAEGAAAAVRSEQKAWPRTARVWRRLLSGYGVVLRTVGGILAIAAATIAAAVALVFPLWYLATNAAGVYTAAVIALLAALVLALVMRRLLRLTDALRRGEYTRRQLLRRARGVATAVLVTALAYTTALLFARGHLVAAGLTALALLVAIGLPAGRLSGRDAGSA